MSPESNQTELARVIDALWKSLGFSSRSAFWEAAGITNKTYWNKRLAGTVPTAKKHVDQLVEGLRQAGYTITPQQEANLRTAIGMAVTINPEPSPDASAIDNITRRLADILRPMPLTYRAAVQRMIEDYQAVFGGRDAELAELDTFLVQETKPYALLLAPTGRGKTALLIHWVARVQARGDWTIIFAPISLRYQTASASATLGMLAQALAEFHHERERLQTYEHTPEQFRPLIADYLRQSPTAGRRLLLVLDGLDEAIGWNLSRDLFPRTPGSHIKIVATAREMAHRQHTTWLEDLGWGVKQTCSLTVRPLSNSAVSDILYRMGNPLDKLATDMDLLAEIGRVSQGDPLTIRLLIEALQDEELTLARLTNLPPGLETFMRSWVDELEQQSSHASTIRMLLGLCATALGPLTCNDLEELEPVLFHARDELNQAAKAVARFIIGDGSSESGYVFSHQRLREVFLETVFSKRQIRDLRNRYVLYGEKCYNDSTHSISDYIRQFWVIHLAQLEAWAIMRHVLTSVVSIGERCRQLWSSIRYAIEGSYSGYLADLDILWFYAEEQNDIVLVMHCSIIASSIQSMSGNLSPELLAGLVMRGTKEGIWSTAVALEHIRQMPHENQKVDALQALIECKHELSYDYATEIAYSISNKIDRAASLILLAPHLPPESQINIYMQAINDISTCIDRDLQHRKVKAFVDLASNLLPNLLPNVKVAIKSILDPDLRMVANVALAHLLPTEDQLEIYKVFFEAYHNTEIFSDSAIFSGKLVNLLPKDLRDRIYACALDDARGINNDWFRAGFLQGLAPNIPAEYLSVAIDIVKSINNKSLQIETLAEFAVHFPIEQRLQIYKDALENANTITGMYRWAVALAEAATSLPSEQRAVICESALDVARSLSNIPFYGAATLAGVATFLPAEQQVDIYTEALSTAKTIRDQGEYAGVLAGLMPYLSPHRQEEICVKAFHNARASSSMAAGSGAIEKLAPYLSIEMIMDLYEYALHMEDVGWRINELCVLLRYLPSNQRTEALAEALAVARNTTEIGHRAFRLSHVVSHLSSSCPIDLIIETMRAVDAAKGNGWCAHSLQNIAPYISPDLLSEALDIVQSIDHAAERAEALAGLVPYLTSELVARATAIASSILVETIEDEVEKLASVSRIDPLQLSTDPWEHVAKSFALIALALCDQSDDAVDSYRKALDATDVIMIPDRRAKALVILAPQLPEVLLLEALNIANSISATGSPGWSATALQALSLRLASFTSAFPSNVSVAKKYWQESIRIASKNTRSDFLDIFAALIPWTSVLMSTSMLEELIILIDDVESCWP